MGFARFFIVALVVAGLAVAGLVGAQHAFVYGSTRGTSCDAPTVGVPVVAARTERREIGDDEVRRVVSLVAPVDANLSGFVVVCVASGDFTFRPSTDGLAHITFVVESSGFWSNRAVDDTRVEPSFAVDGGVFVVGVSQVREGLRVPFLAVQGAKVHVVLELPASSNWRLQAHSTVGRVVVDGLPLSGVDIVTGVGDVRIRAPRLDGHASLSSSVGVLDVAATILGPGRLDLHADAGDIKLILPPGAAPLDLHALTHVGAPRIDVANVDAAPLLKRGNGAEASARSPGLDVSEPHVFVDASTRVGDVIFVGG